MRTKNRGGRSRVSKLPSEPSATSLRFLNQPCRFEAHPDCSHHGTPVNEANDDGIHSIVPETLSDSDDRRPHDLAPNSSGKTVVLAEKLRGSASQDVVNRECLETGWTEKETCIKCDKGGCVLVCSDSGCPLAVHQKCMRCSPSFDDMGNFYCPNCSYKRAIAESCHARKKAMLAKKALSIFIDANMINGEQKQKAERAKRKEPNLSTVPGDSNHYDNENRLDSVQAEEDQEEDVLAAECTRNIPSFKGAKESLVNKRNDVLLSSYGENAKMADHDQRGMVLEHQTHPKPSVVCGSHNIHCSQEGTTPANQSFQASITKGKFGKAKIPETHQFVIEQVGERIQVEHSRQVDDCQQEGVVEDQQQTELLNAFHIEEETNVDGALHVLTKGKRDNAKIFEKNQGRREEEERMHAEATGGGPAVQVHEKANIGFETSDSLHGDTETVLTRRRRAAQRAQNIIQPLNVDPPRKSSSELNTTAEENSEDRNKEVITSSKSIQLQGASKKFSSPTFPNARRKKLPWTPEEEEMLKEGVQKFSTTVNKNLPWRKILEFGRHIFDGTRTPVDLKDKWRNNLVKGMLNN